MVAFHRVAQPKVENCNWSQSWFEQRFPLTESICGRLGGRNYAFAEGHQIPFPDHGSAGIKAMRFYWTGYKCEPFQYNGRAGNWNNFLTKDDCIAYCDYNKVTKSNVKEAQFDQL